MTKVLQIVSTWGNGGVERYISEFQPFLSDKYIYDVLAIRGIVKESLFSNNILKNGGKILSINEKNGLSFLKRWKYRFSYIVDFCKENNYSIVHINGTTADALLYSYLIKKHCPNISVIVHCHGDNVDPPNVMFKKILHYLVRLFYKRTPDYCLGCSKRTLKWMFGEKTLKVNKQKVLYCGIDIDEFQYSVEKRDRFRKSFNCEDDFLIGTVGRFCEQKNPMYILQIISELKKMTLDFKFVWVGEGVMMDEIQKYATDMELVDNIIFAGIQKDISAVYSGLDIFILPSIYEGNPIVGFEAQASGLKCFFSNHIVEEARVIEKTEFLPIALENTKEWAFKILAHKKNYERCNTRNELLASGHDIKSCAFELKRIYDSFREE